MVEPNTQVALRGRPRDLRLDDAIVAATLDLLAERGYSGLSLAAVAERAGTTTPAIYRRWPSKADLVLHAVFRTEGDDVIADTGDLEADVRTMVRWSLEKLGSPQGRAALAGLLGEPPGSAGGRLDQLSGLWGRHRAHLSDATSRGQVRPDVDPNLFVALLAGPAMLAGAVLGATADDEEWVERLASGILDGIRPRGATDAGPEGDH